MIGTQLAWDMIYKTDLRLFQEGTLHHYVPGCTIEHVVHKIAGTVVSRTAFTARVVWDRPGLPSTIEQLDPQYRVIKSAKDNLP